MATTTCPVFTPSNEDFHCFRRYICDVIEKNEEARNAGLCKIIPPKAWQTKYRLTEKEVMEYASKFDIQSPVAQYVGGARGVYTVNLVERKTMSGPAFKQLADEHSWSEQDMVKRVRAFWKGLGINMGVPIYGADVPGTFFRRDEQNQWNIADLDSELRLLPNVPGVNTPMLYFGMWRALFSFHTEDFDLYSVNYIHAGAPKSWWSISPKDAVRFQNLVQGSFPEGFTKCGEYLRHKTSLLSPGRLSAAGISFVTALQEAGEFMINFPKAYHAGFNHGWNVAESANFSTEHWFEMGHLSHNCDCRPDTVRINVERLEALAREHRERWGDSVPFKKSRRIEREEDHKYAALSKKEAQALKDAEKEARRGEMRRRKHRNKVKDWKFNLKEDWVFSCSCGIVCLSTTRVSDWPKGLQFECSECVLWCHAACAFGEEVTDVSQLPVPSLCPFCQEDVEETKMGRKRHRPIHRSYVWDEEGKCSREGMVIAEENGQVKFRLKGNEERRVSDGSSIARTMWIPSSALLSRGMAVCKQLRCQLAEIKTKNRN